VNIEELIDALQERSFDAKREETRLLAEHFLVFFMWQVYRETLKKEDDVQVIKPNLARFVHDGFDMLRTGPEGVFVQFRLRYRNSFGVPLMDVADPRGLSENMRLARENTVLEVADIFADIFSAVGAASATGRGLAGKNGLFRERFLAHFFAHDEMCVRELRLFLLAIYRRGLFSLIQKEKFTHMQGVFGETEFSSDTGQGRIFLSFVSVLEPDRKRVVFAGGTDDFTGNSFTLHSVATDHTGVAELIGEVLRYWPKKRIAQKKVFHAPQSMRALN